VITFENVSKRYGERLALDGLSWHMDEGEAVVFLGPNGCGKTSILRLITHEIQPTGGEVAVGTFRGGRLRRGHRALLRRTLGIVYQDFRLLNDRTVFENIALAVRIAGKFSDIDVIPRVEAALAEVGLATRGGLFPSELSNGEKQRVAIARAIVNRPAVILADEPTGALEAEGAAEVLSMLRRVHEEGGALVVVTTRPDVAAALPARVLRMAHGRLATADEIPAPPAIQRASV
jgi:cell division transport system ATP-binding protein